MPQPIVPERFDEAMAALMASADDKSTGLPAYLGIRTVEMAPGRMVAELDIRAELLNPFGTAHGGVIAALVDHVLGAVMYPHMERGHWAATTEFKLNLLAPVRDGALRGEGTIVSMSRRTGVVQIELTNGGRLVALAQGTVLITAPKS